ncbi:MAG TPA: hypothetical protein VFN02_13610 [Ktedonobacteraceae bacterium]|nr:hypothetical protein [Ktedonobacteraceae bacterium]
MGTGGYSLFTHINQPNALNAKAQLDNAINDATSRMHTPQGLLQPIRAREQQMATTTDGSLAGWQRATQEYTHLRAQVQRLVAMSPADAKAMTERDLTQLQSSVATLAKTKVPDAGGYQNRLQQAQNTFTSATTTHDYFVLDGFVRD